MRVERITRHTGRFITFSIRETEGREITYALTFHHQSYISKGLKELEAALMTAMEEIQALLEAMRNLEEHQEEGSDDAS